MPYKDPQKQKQAQQEWYQKNMVSAGIVAEKSKEARIRTKKWYNEIMSDKFCKRCGESDTVVLEWHHLDPSKKDMSIAEMLSRRGKKTILKEIEKCECFCANCHRRLHHELRTGV